MLTQLTKKQEPFLHYLPYSKEDEKLGMVCTTAGDIDVHPYTVYPPNINEHPSVFRRVADERTLPEFQMVYISAGEGVFSSDSRTYMVTPGTLLLILPGIKHYYKPVYEIGWHEYWVGFRGVFFTHMVNKGMLSREHVFFEIGLRDCIISTYNHIFEEIRSQKPLYQLKACADIFSLIAEMLTFERRKEQPNHYQQIVEQAKYLMESNIYGAINMSAITAQLHISASKLNEIFKTYTAMTPYQYYIQIKIQKAESILEQEDIPIKEVAFRLGFDDQYYFSRLFKNKTGIAPSYFAVNRCTRS
jgi:AraC-like DNA-binding protein